MMLVAKQKHEQKRRLVTDAMRQLREQNRISLRALAREMNFTAPYVSDVELNRRAVSQDFLEKYFKALRALKKNKQKE